ncbi:MAG: hypothetical protein ABSH05_04670 [Bryobacteraceae bacterium]|jgi:hypothetical protein
MCDLPELLVRDWYSLFIFTEYDLQVATYYWFRQHFERTRSERWSVRTQPRLVVGPGKTFKPDVVVFKDTLPYDVLELKCHITDVRADRWGADLEKLRQLKDKWNVRHAYQLILYDDDDVWDLPAQKEPWMKHYVTFVGANVRRHETGRMRRGYEHARRRWERWRL